MVLWSRQGFWVKLLWWNMVVSGVLGGLLILAGLGGLGDIEC